MFTKFRTRKGLVERDVPRTDRNIPYFADEHGEGLKYLFDILVTYSMFNFDLGYAQGMNDLLAPILETLRDEVLAFWCFKGFLEEAGPNFSKNQLGMNAIFSRLKGVLEVVDPTLFAYLCKSARGCRANPQRA